MELSNDPVRVVFRFWRGQVIALFPNLEWDTRGNCASYQHIGQHGAADYRGIIRNSRAATPAEYASLAAELQSGPDPYRLAIVTHARGRMTPRKPARAKRQYSVIVGNIGTVHAGTNQRAAEREFSEWLDTFNADYRGRGNGPVTLTRDGEPVRESAEWEWEYTDTFGGERNYAWVKRGTVHAVTRAHAYRLAKRAAGLDNVRGFGNCTDFRPYRSCTAFSMNCD